MTLRKVVIDGEVHAFPIRTQTTVCGISKVNRQPLYFDGTPTTCFDCVNKHRSDMMRQADDDLGFPMFPEIQYATEIQEVA